jgi:putative beta-barrel porin
MGQSVKSAGRGGNDSLHHRNEKEDSVTIYYRYLDSARHYKLDSSVNDFTTRFPIPATNIYLGNLGTASKSILFSPLLKPGWDPGFHVFDIYKWNPESIRFFNTTRPYTELNYLIGSRTEQVVEAMHTQNIKPNWNASFRYRFINSPGFFQNQHTNHNNILFSSWYEGKAKRYNNYFFVLANHLQSAENGGIKDDHDYLSDTKTYKDRFNIPTILGNDQEYSNDFFSTNITIGNRYREFTILMRQQYDLGKKDSLVTDSTVIPLFYPRVRFEHTISYNENKYQFIDYAVTNSEDSEYYRKNYGLQINPGDSVNVRDRWKNLVNDFSIYQFPDAKNLQQFVRLGAAVQLLKGEFDSTNTSAYNVIFHGEYRNKTRNQKWDAELYGNFYSAGFNSGDYNAHISLRRFVGKKNQGYAEIGFENVNRSPSFLYDTRSSFYIDKTVTTGFKKENSSHIFATIYQPALKLRLSGDYYLISNYTFFSAFSVREQYEPLFNFLRISAQKIFAIGKHWNWYADVYLQQKTGGVPLNVPLIFTRNRIAFEGHFFRNLDLSTGFEVKYHTPYKADNYSPLLGQFFYQDSVTISNRPDISAFVNFRIRSFKAFIRAENLNTMQITQEGGFGFTKNNLAAPGYPYPGLQIRLGVWWNFVN